MSLHLRQGECFGRGGSRWGDSRDWRLYGSGFTVAGRLCWCSRVPRGWWVLHTRACSVLVGIAESCGTALSVTVMALLPCADPTSPHMGARPPHTTLTEKSRHSNNNQPPPRIDPALPCATPMTTTPITTHPPRPTPRSVRFRLEIGPIQPGQPDVEARTTSSRAKATCRTSEPSTNSRPAEARPISTRNSTDLAAEPDRSRREFRPISTRNRTDLGEGRADGRAGPRAARPLGVGRRRREETATPPPLVLFPCQAREMREASSTCSGVGRTPV